MIRGMLTAAEVSAAQDRLHDTIDRWPSGAPASVFAEGEAPGTPLADIDPAVLEGRLETPRARELAVRRLFRLAVRIPKPSQNPLLFLLCKQKKISEAKPRKLLAHEKAPAVIATLTMPAAAPLRRFTTRTSPRS